MAELKMFAAGIDNGSHFDMRAKDITFGWKNIFDVENEVGKSIGSIWNIRSPSSRYGGYEAPVVKFGGLIDTTATALGSNAGGSLFVNIGRLGSIALMGSAYILYPTLSNFLGSPFSNLLTGSVPVIIDSVDLTGDTSYCIGSEYIVNYSMSLRLVSGPV
jgi:hypothetical protein